MRFIYGWKEPMSALTHFIGLILVIPCVIILICSSAMDAGARYVVSFSIFGAAIILLYFASTVYHMLNVGERLGRLLKRFDHMMIFVLIAGTYTPVCLVCLKGAWGYTLLSIIWALALCGIILKAVWINVPRVLPTVIYVAMGWLVLVAFYPLCRNVPLQGIALLALGGIIYTIGAFIYSTKPQQLHSGLFGFHEVFHLFVMGGSFCHLLFMFRYVLIPGLI